MVRRPRPRRPRRSAPAGSARPPLDWPDDAPKGRRRRADRLLEHARVEVDLIPGMERSTTLPGLHQLEELFHEVEIIEEGTLLGLAAGALGALATVGYDRVDHWEVRPGGWLPLRRVPRGPQVEPVQQFLDALRTTEWKAMAAARELAGRLSDARGNRLEFEVRRLHRERQHSLSFDLYGRFRRGHVAEVAAVVARRLPMLRAQVTALDLAPAPG